MNRKLVAVTGALMLSRVMPMLLMIILPWSTVRMFAKMMLQIDRAMVGA